MSGPGAGIVWLASYPKSGNTWVRLALEFLERGHLSLNDDAARRFSIASSRQLLDEVLGLNSSELPPDEVEVLRPRAYEALAREAKGSVVLKVHDGWTMTRAGEPLFSPAITRAVIYVVRDPRDVAVSCAHHYMLSMDQAVSQLAGDRTASNPRGGISTQVPQRLLSWSAHVESWLDAPRMPVLVVRYEICWRILPPNWRGSSPLPGSTPMPRPSNAPHRRRVSAFSRRRSARRASAKERAVRASSFAGALPGAGVMNSRETRPIASRAITTK